MERKNSKPFFLGLSLLFIIFASVLGIYKFNESQELLCLFPSDFEIDSIPVGGLTPTLAREKVLQIYESPITLKIQEASILLSPKDFISSHNIDLVVETASQPCTQLTSWEKYWTFIWNKQISGFESSPIILEIDDSKLKNFVDEQIINRYIEQPIPSFALPGTTQFTIGKPGTSIDIDLLVDSISQAIQEQDEKLVEIPVEESDFGGPSVDQIAYLLQNQIQKSNFAGVVEIYLKNLTNGETIHFASQNGNSVNPDIAFTAASTMKIPIMIASLKRESYPVDDLVLGWMNRMIIYSENDPADRLMERINPISGPLVVSEDLRELGLQNTFISGYFYLGAPLLAVVDTPSNTRSDINLDPDLYNQTTTSDIGNLLADVYDCANNGTGKLIDISNGGINSEKCKLMIDVLSQNQIGALIEAGLPESSQIAHKHGWSEESDGLLHTVSDVAIIFAPENDFIFTVFVYSPNQLFFDDANYLIAQLAQIAFNGLNPHNQLTWLFTKN